MVNIAGVDKVKLVQELYKNAQPLGLGIFQYDEGQLSEEEALQIVTDSEDMDYLHGRCMKIRVPFNSVEIEETYYERDNGKGVVQGIVDALRQGKEYIKHFKCPKCGTEHKVDKHYKSMLNMQKMAVLLSSGQNVTNVCFNCNHIELED